MEEFMSPTPPQDSCLVLIIFYYMAIGTLIPWNFFINVNGYWMYKFRTVSNQTEEQELPNTGAEKNALQIEFTSDLAIAAMIPNVTFLVLNGIIGHRFKMAPRLLGSLVCVVILFIVTLVLVKVNSDAWQLEFLIVTLAVVVILNIFSATFQGGLFGLAGCFPPKYMNGVLSGQGIGGILVALINIALLALGGDSVTAAFYCFLFSVIFLILSVLALYYLTTTPLYKYYVLQQQRPRNSSETTPLLGGQRVGEGDQETKTVCVLDILKHIKVEALTVLMIYIVTLGCFPALTVLVESTDKDQGGDWENKYFVPVACFLFYNLGDYIGRLIVGSNLLPKISSRLALLSSILRVAIIPCFMFCNLAPQERTIIDIYFPSDTVYIILMFIFSISNGYLTSIVMLNAPAKVEDYQQQTASNLMVGLLGLGLVSGAGLSGGLVKTL